MAGISTHALNVTTGRPIAGLRVELYDVAQSPPQRLNSTRTNADGRTDSPMLAAQSARTGDFELRFYVGEHFKEPTALSEEVLVRFSIFDAAQHYHVPMLCSPWFFTTYRGS
ncbi:hydroxyisourate hydrolase [Comamonas aquatilis]|uniref:hydroxyisourate hydrolase n=1 Tax=Comamonas TaxID=283 RepID=UPI000EB5C867|nr:hydroxyisourate hydrolase [Comamonas sp. lk]